MDSSQTRARRLRIGCEFNHIAQAPTSASFIVRPSGAAIVTERWTSDPALDRHTTVDLHGNEVWRMMLPAGESLVSYYAVVDVPDEVDERDLALAVHAPQDLPDDTLVYTLPSRYCQSDMMGARAWELFGAAEHTLSTVESIEHYVFANVEYRTGSTGSWWTAADSLEAGYGVCRDFAHLMISFCRALNIPARYVCGYLPDLDVPVLPTPMDFHAWVEVFAGDRWWTFDPRHAARRKGHIPISHGRDAADVAMVTTFGAPWLRRLTVWADEDLSAPWPPEDTSLAARNPFV